MSGGLNWDGSCIHAFIQRALWGRSNLQDLALAWGMISQKAKKTAQMFWPDGLSISPFNEKWESTKGAGGEAGRLKENDILLLAGSWYKIVLIFYQIFWHEAKLNEAFLFGDGIMIQRNSFSQVFFFFFPLFLIIMIFFFVAFLRSLVWFQKLAHLGLLTSLWEPLDFA